MGGNSLSNGQVEIGFEEQFWGGICQTSWSYEDATVLCRMLDFERGLPTFSSTFGLGVHRSWLTSVNCIGEEKSILDCVKLGWNVPCDPSYHAGVICLGVSCDLCSCNINIIPINIGLCINCTEDHVPMLFSSPYVVMIILGKLNDDRFKD